MNDETSRSQREHDLGPKVHITPDRRRLLKGVAGTTAVVGVFQPRVLASTPTAALSTPATLGLMLDGGVAIPDPMQPTMCTTTFKVQGTFVGDSLHQIANYRLLRDTPTSAVLHDAGLTGCRIFYKSPVVSDTVTYSCSTPPVFAADEIATGCTGTNRSFSAGAILCPGDLSHSMQNVGFIGSPTCGLGGGLNFSWSAQGSVVLVTGDSSGATVRAITGGNPGSYTVQVIIDAPNATPPSRCVVSCSGFTVA